MQHLEDHGLLTDSQHSFGVKHSCETQLQTLVDGLLHGVAEGKQYDLAMMNFSNAFDVAPYKRLFEKTQYYCIKGPCQDWIENFQKNRVVVDDESIQEAAVRKSMSHGSVLGPIYLLPGFHQQHARACEFQMPAIRR